MIHNKFTLWAATALFTLATACTESDMLKEEVPQEPAKPHTYRLSIDMPVPSHDGQTTRSATEWENGSEVKFKFYTGYHWKTTDPPQTTYYYTTGTAVYNASEGVWTLTLDGELDNITTSPIGMLGAGNVALNDFEARYYQNSWPEGTEQMDSEINKRYGEAVFYGTGSYIREGDSVIYASTTLKPCNWRLRFKGEEGEELNFWSSDIKHNIGVSLYTNQNGVLELVAFKGEEENLKEDCDTLSLTVIDDCTPYIYGTFKNEEGDNTITVETGGQKYSRTISGTALKPGETGYMVIPTESNYKAEGWTIVEEAIEPEAVDLGLSVKWANMNVGASKPEDYGDYFAWGETEPKSTYNWNTYKWCNGGSTSMTKYCTSSSYGTVDSKTQLEASDDAATANWGSDWRMPTTEEQQELINNCTWVWTTQNGVNGYRITGTNGNSIFLPAAGYIGEANLNHTGSHGFYWSLSLSSWDSDRASDLGFSSDYCDLDDILNRRFEGQSVRPVQGDRTIFTTSAPDTPLTFAATPSEAQTIAVTSNEGWTATSDATSWCTVSPASGSNNGTVKVTVVNNTSTSQRYAIITIKGKESGDETKVTVTQNGVAPHTTATPVTLTFKADATDSPQNIAVTSNEGWTATSDATSWCTVSPASGSNNGTVKVTVVKNTSTSQRSAIITIKGKESGDETKVTVTQNGVAPHTTALPVTLTFKADATDSPQNITVTSNEGWTATSDATSWCTVSPASGSNNGTVKVTVVNNTSTSQRSAIITIKGKESGDETKVTVTQKGKSVSDIDINPFGDDEDWD